MGQILDTGGNIDTSKNHQNKRKMSQNSREPRYPRDKFPHNGLMLNEVYLPGELIVEILSHVSGEDLLSCLLVCHTWSELIEQEVWRTKAEMEYPMRFKKYSAYRKLPSLIYQGMCFKPAYNHNLLVNSSGQANFNGWKIVSDGGDKWVVESPPAGVTRPDGVTYEDPIHCFVTSYRPCEMQQTIDLLTKGIHPKILDEYSPDIIVSEWYAARWDCNSYYNIKITLLDENKDELEKFTDEVTMTSWRQGWKVVSHTFKDYSPGVRYVEFIHKGHDLQFWAGHYGSKMANAKVVVDVTNLKAKPE